MAPCSGVSVVDFGQVNAGWVLVILMTKFLLTNNIFDGSIYFVVIFCSIRLFFTVNINDFNNYFIYIMKLQLFMVLWSVLSLLWFWGRILLEPANLFALQVDWLVSLWCGFSAGGDFRTDSST